ncbi:MAG: hypothetical protein AAGF76_15385, partial [Pseudomonadota bacterium]
ALNALLTQLLAAVSQQFFHMLLLGKRGRADLAARLKRVDDQDFPNAMQIVDLLLREGAQIRVAPHAVAPAQSTAAILRTELAFERDLAAFLPSLAMRSPEAQERLASAMAPRDDYRGWLVEILRHTPVDPSSGRRESPQLFSVLLQLMEQTLLHAFANWHDGRTAEVSTSWQISGAAMLYLTALADFCGSDDQASGGIEIPGSTVIERTARFGADLHLVRESASAARRLAEVSDDLALAALCLTIAEDCGRIAGTRNGEPIRAELGQSAVFRNFRRARHRMTR